MAELDLHCRMIMEEYERDLDQFEKIKEIVTEQIKAILAENNMMVTAVEARVKTRDSLEGKLDLKGYKYATLSDITDIVGARVITIYSIDVDKIASWVERMFDIDWVNSVDKRKAHGTDSFGYMSLHYVCRIPKRLYDDPAMPGINEYRFELQLRTALQHVWASAFHDTGYKSDVEIPKEYVRALSRLSGLLELADEQFSQIIDDLSEYRRKVRALIKDGKLEELEINGDTIRDYLAVGHFDRLNERIASINHAEISHDFAEKDFPALLGALDLLGIKTLADLEQVRQEYSEAAYQLATLQLGNTDIDILSASVGIRNLCLVYMVKKGGGEAGLHLLLDKLNGGRKSNARTAARVLKQAQSLNMI